MIFGNGFHQISPSMKGYEDKGYFIVSLLKRSQRLRTLHIIVKSTKEYLTLVFFELFYIFGNVKKGN